MFKKAKKAPAKIKAPVKAKAPAKAPAKVPAKKSPVKKSAPKKQKPEPEQPLYLESTEGNIVGRLRVNAHSIDRRQADNGREYAIVNLSGRSESDPNNNTFTTEAPELTFSMRIDKPGALDRLQQGKDYYLDLVEV